MPTQVCTQCSATNPADAAYCYFDGVRLAGASGGPVNPGTQNFPMPFTFPSGQVCRNFDQFATTCQENWAAALGLLKDGLLANFFGGLGRADLALAAQEAVRAPDPDRGFDQFLDKLPSQVLQRPKLKVEPSEINLGELPIGAERTIELNLTNAGMRLLYGSVASDCKWLTLGDAPGSSQKLFQFGAESSVSVHVVGSQVRAGAKPIEGQLLIESNGGPATIVVKALVPVKPLKGGLLDGSISPRQVAEKARKDPAAAAQFFEDGTVAEWFKSNGWTYPVQGPSVKGLGAVQQFFEALGLAKGPKVQIGTQAISLKGKVGQSVQTTIEVSTQEKKLVYAHATCEQPWVDVSKVKLAGRLATITVAVPTIPDRPGETLETKVIVAGNGNQRFTVPLKLAIAEAAVNPFADLGGASPAAARTAPAAGNSGTTVANSAAATIKPTGNPFADLSDADDEPALISRPGSSSGTRLKPEAAPSPAMVASQPPTKRAGWVHLLPLLLLLGAVATLPLRDWLQNPRAGAGTGSGSDLDLDPTPYMVLIFNHKADKNQKPEPGEPAFFPDEMSYGARVLDLDFDKKGNERTSEYVKILYGDRGQTNNTSIKVGNATGTFGKLGEGNWVARPKVTPWESSKKPLPGYFAREGVATWNFKNIHVTQTVRIVPGEPVEVNPGEIKRLQNVCEVRYKLENADTAKRDVGLRVLLDTLIGKNDGAPFTVPGMQGLVTQKEFATADEVPDFIMALEKDDLAQPGVVVQLNLHHSGLESPSRVLLTRWPASGKVGREIDAALEKWEVPLANIGNDSSVVMYWPAQPLEPKKSRHVGFAFGMGSAAARSGGSLSVSVGGDLTKGTTFSVIAMAKNPSGNERATLELPPELKLTEGDTTQPVPPSQKGRPVPMTWRVRAPDSGRFPMTLPITVKTNSGQTLRIHVVITEPSIF